ncbi:MAG: hypothetical protein ACYCVD_17895 [Desulfitobacteriaceae bacterium]
MQEAIQWGPFLLKTQWLVIVVSGLAGYVVLRYRLKPTEYPQKRIAETIENSLIIAFVVWKFSLLLFNPVSVVTNPLALIYFSGGERGAWLSVAVLVFYFYHRSKKEHVSIWVYGDLLAAGFLAATAVYHLILLFLHEQTVWIDLSKALISLLVLLAILRTRAVGKPYYLNQTFLWFSLGQVFVSYLDPLKHNYLWGFSKEQVLFLLLAVLSLTLDSFMKKRKF